MIHALTTIIGAALLMVLIGVLIGAAVCFFAEDRGRRNRTDLDERARVRARANESLARQQTRPYGVDLDVEPQAREMP